MLSRRLICLTIEIACYMQQILLAKIKIKGQCYSDKSVTKAENHINIVFYAYDLLHLMQMISHMSNFLSARVAT